MSGGRPKGSTSALAARASRRNILGGRKLPRAGKRWELIADRREEARLAREEAQAIREQAKARAEVGELCLRSEALAEVTRLYRIVRAELDRAAAYLDPGLAPEVRTEVERALATATRKLRQAIAEKAKA